MRLVRKSGNNDTEIQALPAAFSHGGSLVGQQAQYDRKGNEFT